MAVVPAKLDRIRADRLHAFDLQVRSNGGRIDYALARPLILARSARTFAPEHVIKDTIDAVVGPGQFEDLVGLKGPDICGRLGHLMSLWKMPGHEQYQGRLSRSARSFDLPDARLFIFKSSEENNSGDTPVPAKPNASRTAIILAAFASFAATQMSMSAVARGKPW
jgi:hypothetical protein